ncbi:hypothetical protein [Helicobacter cetorum]|nr:hypothetical protein [Helicobacter cetorum]
MINTKLKFQTIMDYLAKQGKNRADYELKPSTGETPLAKARSFLTKAPY